MAKKAKSKMSNSTATIIAALIGAAAMISVVFIPRWLPLPEQAEDKHDESSSVFDETTAYPEDAIYFNGSAYKVFDIGMTWYEAKAYCENLGGHLVTITSQEEQEYIEGLIANHNRNFYWLGGTDVTHEGQWEWVTGETFEYSNWDYGEPYNAGGNDYYLHIYRVPNPHVDAFHGEGSSAAGKWNDASYNVYFNEYEVDFFSLDATGFICEWSSISN